MHLLRSPFLFGLLKGSLVMGQEYFPLRRSDQIFLHSFWKAQRRAISGGSQQDPENCLFTLNLFWVCCRLSAAPVCSHKPRSSCPSLAAHHTWHRLYPEPCSWLPRQKRERESSKPIARTINHGERNIYLRNTFNLHTAANCCPLQQRTAHYKVSQEQKIQPWKCQRDARGMNGPEWLKSDSHARQAQKSTTLSGSRAVILCNVAAAHCIFCWVTEMQTREKQWTV